MTKKNLTPFHVRGKIRFPWKPTLDRAFIFPCPPPTTFIPGGHLIIPDILRGEYTEGIGVLLAIGSGFYDDKGKWHRVSSSLIPGVYVKYDQSVPWRQIETAPDGKQYTIIFCGSSDISGVVEF